MDKRWAVYIVQCVDTTLYTGITCDLELRIEQHNRSDKGAKYTRGRRPVTLVYHQCFSSRSDAQKEEHRIKKLSKNKKISLILKQRHIRNHILNWSENCAEDKC